MISEILKNKSGVTLADLIEQSMFGEDYVMDMIAGGKIKPIGFNPANPSEQLFDRDAHYIIHEEELKNLA